MEMEPSSLSLSSRDGAGGSRDHPRDPPPTIVAGGEGGARGRRGGARARARDRAGARARGGARAPPPFPPRHPRAPLPLGAMAGGPGGGADGQASGQPELGACNASLQRFWERAEHSEWMAWAQRRGEAARIAEAAGGRTRAELERLDAWARALPGDVLQRWAMLDELCLTKEQFLQVMEWKARRQGEAPVELPWSFESLDKADVRAADPCTEPGPAAYRFSLPSDPCRR